MAFSQQQMQQMQQERHQHRQQPFQLQQNGGQQADVTQQAATIAPEMHQKKLQALARRMRGLKNEMDFIEILSHFWILPNMESRMRRLEQEMSVLTRQYHIHKLGIAKR